MLLLLYVMGYFAIGLLTVKIINWMDSNEKASFEPGTQFCGLAWSFLLAWPVAIIMAICILSINRFQWLVRKSKIIKLLDRIVK